MAIGSAIRLMKHGTTGHQYGFDSPQLDADLSGVPNIAARVSPVSRAERAPVSE
jgi:hypothetical protein